LHVVTPLGTDRRPVHSAGVQLGNGGVTAGGDDVVAGAAIVVVNAAHKYNRARRMACMVGRRS
jgi:hypothetical protein